MEQLQTSPSEILDLQQAIVDRIANEAELDSILDELCRLVETIRPGFICSLMQLDPETGTLFVRAAPSAPRELIDELNGLVPGKLAGGCGCAVFTGEPAIVEDALVDPRWEVMRDAAVRFGIRSCWSMPFRVGGAEPVGSFAISGTAPAKPTREEVRLLETAGHLASISIAQEEARQHIRDQKEQVRRALTLQKDESLGQMAGGVAHEFNNILTSILHSAEGVLRQRGLDAAARESLEAVCMGAMRARELTQMMLSYAGKAESRRQPVDLSHMLGELLDLVKLALPDGVRVVGKLEDDLPPVPADSPQLRQVLLNLICNGSEACENGVGNVTVDVRRADERTVEIRVVDDGVGMDAETAARVFDPFFSTKFAGRGLGLAAVQGIVRAHDGTVEVESEPGRGTTFFVRLPVAES